MAGKQRTPPAEGTAGPGAAFVSCWMCGIHLPQAQTVPDGGRACPDIRWYCKDTQACTDRWTSTRRQTLPAGAD
jgi:hypothetical protein